jgi:hypothetical protein
MQKFLAVSIVFCLTAHVPLAEGAPSAAFPAQLLPLAPYKAGVSCTGAVESAPLALLSLQQAQQNQQDPQYQQNPQNQSYSSQLFSPEQLDNLLAPIALYPDPLLAQVLLAATFPDQIDQADREVHANGQYNVDSAPWDVSVKAVSRYPAVLHMMADKLDWTTSLGQAYVSQSSDVMAAVQRLREQARSAGNLATTPQMEVIQNGGYISLWPAQPRYIYVPVYDPAVVFFPRRGFGGEL